jgi:serine protease Do
VAAKAGLAAWDVLMSVDGQATDDTLTLNQVLADKKPGDRVTLKFWSHGNVKNADVVLQELHS